MLKRFEMSADTLVEDIVITRADYGLYYKVTIEGKNSGKKLIKKYKDFDDLLYQYMKLAIRCAWLEDMLEKRKE